MQETSPPLFRGVTRLQARALFIGHRLDLRAFEQTGRLDAVPLTVTAGGDGCAVLFRYGVVVLFGLKAVEEARFLTDVAPFVSGPFPQPEVEEVDLLTGQEGPEGALHPHIQLRSLSLERLQLVADVLAKSVVLAHYEASIADAFDRIEPLAEELQQGGRGAKKGRELLRHIGDTMAIQGKMVGRVEVHEKPELLWERPEFERLYLRLEDEYELAERQQALERKLELIARTAETMLGLLQNKRSLRVEWYIVLLIVLEVLLTLYEMFLR
jgi:uncharacterized Rmd1/YagE family protein